MSLKLNFFFVFGVFLVCSLVGHAEKSYEELLNESLSKEKVSETSVKEFELGKNYKILKSALSREACLGNRPSTNNLYDNKSIHFNMSFEYGSYDGLSTKKDAIFYSDLSRGMDLQEKQVSDIEFLETSSSAKKRKEELLKKIEGTFVGKKEAWFTFSGHGFVDENGKSLMLLPGMLPADEKNFGRSCVFYEGEDKRRAQNQRHIIMPIVRVSSKFENSNGQEEDCLNYFLTMEEVIGKANDANIKNLFISSDSCYAGAIEKSLNSPKGVNVVALMSSQADETSVVDYAEDAGYFTTRLKRVLEDPKLRDEADLNGNKQLSLAEFMNYTLFLGDRNKKINEEIFNSDFCATGNAEFLPEPTAASSGINSSFLNRVVFDWSRETPKTNSPQQETDSTSLDQHID